MEAKGGGQEAAGGRTAGRSCWRDSPEAQLGAHAAQRQWGAGALATLALTSLRQRTPTAAPKEMPTSRHLHPNGVIAENKNETDSKHFAPAPPPPRRCPPAGPPPWLAAWPSQRHRRWAPVGGMGRVGGKVSERARGGEGRGGRTCSHLATLPSSVCEGMSARREGQEIAMQDAPAAPRRRLAC